MRSEGHENSNNVILLASVTYSDTGTLRAGLLGLSGLHAHDCLMQKTALA